MSEWYSPVFNSRSFHCLYCHVYANQRWAEMRQSSGPQIRIGDGSMWASFCTHCKEPTIWLGEKIIYPTTGEFPLANSDLYDDVKEIYAEASTIAQQSPRAACALLRLAVQMLLEHLGEKGTIHDGIKNLVNKGLDPQIQQALDTLRVTGNHAVHPGVIDVDDITNVQPLFSLINIIADALISQPKRVQETYNSLLPDKDRNAIDKRDKRAT